MKDLFFKYRRLALDLAERVVWTFVQAALPLVAAADTLFDGDVWRAAFYAGLAAALALIKGIGAAIAKSAGTPQLGASTYKLAP